MSPPAVLTEMLRRWALRQRRQHAALALAWTVAGAGLLVAAAMAVDLAGDPLPWLRLGLAAGGLLGLLAGAILALRRLFAPWRQLATARAIERCAGLAGEPLSGPLGLLDRPVPGHSAWMAARALALAAVIADAVEIRRLLPWRPVLPALLLAATTVLVLSGAALAEPTARAAIIRAMLPWRDLPAPGDEPLVAEPGDAWLAPGARHRLVVRDQAANLAAELVWADGRRESLALQRDGAVQHVTLGPLHRDLRWRVRGPGLASPWHQATLVAAPRLAALAMRLVPPGYTGLPEERVPGGDARVITGTDATIDIVLEGPPAATAALVTDGREVPVELEASPYGGQSGTARLRVTADLAWHLRLIVAGGPGGVVVDLPQRWHLHAVPDQPPAASLGVEHATVAPGRALQLSVLAGDDVALASVWLELGDLGSTDPLRLALPVAAGARRLEATATIVPADLGARPGDLLTVVPVARDRAGSETRGSAIHLAVAQPVHAARHDLVLRLDGLVALAGSAVAAATESEKAWRAALRTWREEDPAAGAAGLRAAATRARDLSAAATAVADGAAAAAVLGDAPANLEALADRALVVAGGALALAARSAAAEGGASADVDGAAEAAAGLVRGAESLATSARLAAAAAAATAAVADFESARNQLAGAAEVLAAERAWANPDQPPDPRTRKAMTVLPAGAGAAALLRAQRAAGQALAADAAIARAVDANGAQAELLAQALRPLAEDLGRGDLPSVSRAAAAVTTATVRATTLARRLAEACHQDRGRDGGDPFGERLRGAAAKPGGKLAQRVTDELAVQRTALAGLAAEGLGEPAQRSAALAAAWAVDAVIAALAGEDGDAARAAVAAATPPLALAARHARAAEAAAGLAGRGGAVLAELAVSPGWPPGLLRPARDRLREAAAGLRAGAGPERAALVAGETSLACAMETLRPGAPPSEELASAAAWLRDQMVLPQAEALAEIADLLEMADRAVPQARPESRALAAAAEQRRSLAAASLAASAARLAAAVPALAAAGLPDLAQRAGSLAELARTCAGSPDQKTALGLAEALSGSLAAPLAEALASGRLKAGSAAAQAGRLAAQAAAEAATLASIAIPAPDVEDAARWDRPHDRSAGEAASAAAAVDFPEEHRAAVRAYLRRLGASR